MRKGQTKFAMIVAIGLVCFLVFFGILGMVKGGWGNIKGLIESKLPGETIPTDTKLIEVWPETFSYGEDTSIKFELSEKTDVSINIYDTEGVLKVSLKFENKEAGTHTLIWKGEDEKGEELPNGIYFLQLKAENYSSKLKKIVKLTSSR